MKRALPRLSISSSPWDTGYASNSDTWFTFLKSLQKRTVLSGSSARTMGLDRALSYPLLNLFFAGLRYPIQLLVHCFPWLGAFFMLNKEMCSLGGMKRLLTTTLAPLRAPVGEGKGMGPNCTSSRASCFHSRGVRAVNSRSCLFFRGLTWVCVDWRYFGMWQPSTTCCALSVNVMCLGSGKVMQDTTHGYGTAVLSVASLTRLNILLQ